MSAPSTVKTAPISRRSFNQSIADWNMGRRGPTPDTLWGARALEALKPWEDHQEHLVMSVARAIEEAYKEGKAGAPPRMPDIREDLRPGEHAPAPVEEVPPKRKVVVRKAPEPASAIRGLTFAELHAIQQATKQPLKTLAREGTVAGYTRVIKGLQFGKTSAPKPTPAPARRVVIRK